MIQFSKSMTSPLFSINFWENLWQVKSSSFPTQRQKWQPLAYDELSLFLSLRQKLWEWQKLRILAMIVRKVRVANIHHNFFITDIGVFLAIICERRHKWQEIFTIFDTTAKMIQRERQKYTCTMQWDHVGYCLCLQQDLSWERGFECLCISSIIALLDNHTLSLFYLKTFHLRTCYFQFHDRVRVRAMVSAGRWGLVLGQHYAWGQDEFKFKHKICKVKNRPTHLSGWRMFSSLKTCCEAKCGSYDVPVGRALLHQWL